MQVGFSARRTSAPVAQTPMHQRRMWKFGCPTKSAPFPVKAARQLQAAISEWLVVERELGRCRRRFQLAQGTDYGAGTGAQLAQVIAIVIGNVVQQFLE